MVRIVQEYLQQQAIELLFCPAMLPEMNPIEHLWDYLGRKVNACTPNCKTIQELVTTLAQEWQQYPQHRLRRLIHGMRRRVQELFKNTNVR